MNKDAVKKISLVGGVLIAMLVILMLTRQSCNGGLKNFFRTTTIVSVTHDTTVRYIQRTDTQYVEVKGETVREYVSVKTHGDTVIKFIDKFGVVQTLECDNDTATYSDSIRMNNEFKAVITEQISHSKRFNYNIQWANLTPEMVITDKETITKIKNAFLKVYAGGHIVVSTNYTVMKSPVDIAPSLSLIISDRYLISARYALINQQPSLGFEVKLSLKKK